MHQNKKLIYIFYILLSILFALFIVTTRHRFWIDNSSYVGYFLSNFFREKFLLFFFVFFLYFLILKNFFFLNILISKKEFYWFILIFIINIIFLFLRYHNISLGLFYFFSVAINFIYLFYIIKKNNLITLNSSVKYVITLLIILFFSLSFLSYQITYKYYKSFHAIGGDFGFNINTLWQKANGYPEITWIEKPGLIVRNAVHFEPIKYFLLPIINYNYSEKILLLFQTIGLFSSIFFIYLLTLKLFNNYFAALLLTSAYSISHYMIRSIDSDFHFIAIFALAISGFIYFSHQKNFIMTILFFILTIIIREDTPLYISLICFYLFLKYKNRLFLYLMFFSGLYFFTLIKYYMPALHSYNTHALNVWKTFKSFNINFNIDILGQILILLGGVLFLPLYDFKIFIFFVLPPIIVFFTYGGNIIFNAQHSVLIFPALFISSTFALQKLYQNKKIDLIFVCLSIFIIQCFLHLAWTPNFSLIINTLIILSFLTLIFILPYDNLHVNMKVFLIITLSIITFYFGYIRYNKYRTEYNPERISTIKEAINYLPIDVEIPVLTNFSIAPHIAKRKYISSIEHPKIDSAAKLLNDIIFIKAKIFYIIHDTKGDHIYNPLKANEMMSQIIKLSEKLNFKNNIIFNKNGVVVIKFIK